jgi:hypothetical protein
MQELCESFRSLRVGQWGTDPAADLRLHLFFNWLTVALENT